MVSVETTVDLEVGFSVEIPAYPSMNAISQKTKPFRVVEYIATSAHFSSGTARFPGTLRRLMEVEHILVIWIMVPQSIIV